MALCWSMLPFIVAVFEAFSMLRSGKPSQFIPPKVARVSTGIFIPFWTWIVYDMLRYVFIKPVLKWDIPVKGLICQGQESCRMTTLPECFTESWSFSSARLKEGAEWCLNVVYHVPNCYQLLPIPFILQLDQQEYSNFLMWYIVDHSFVQLSDLCCSDFIEYQSCCWRLDERLAVQAVHEERVFAIGCLCKLRDFESCLWNNSQIPENINILISNTYMDFF